MIVISGQEHDAGAKFFLGHPVGNLLPINTGHIDIDDSDAGVQGPDKLKGSRAIFRLANHLKRGFQRKCINYTLPE